MTRALRSDFWTLPLGQLTAPEWEALCDGCGKCCLNKLEDEDTGQVVFTRVACKLLDGDSCQCTNYVNRLKYVPECVVLRPDNMADIAYFMPHSCAYRLRYEGKALPDWHPLVSGDPASVHLSGHSVQGWTVSEAHVPEEDWEDHLINEEP